MGATENFIKVRNAEGGVHRLAAADLPTGSGTVTDEQIRDVIGAALVAGANITITVNDAGDTITIAATSSGGTNYWESAFSGSRLRINAATTGLMKEFYPHFPGELTYLYMSDFGTTAGRIVQLVGQASVEINAGTQLSLTSGANNNISLGPAGTGKSTISKALIYTSLTTSTVFGSITIDPMLASIHKLTLSNNITPTFSSPPAGLGVSLTLYLIQDATGGRTVTWPSSVKWPGSIVPVLSTVGNSVDIVVMETLDGGTTWFANLAGKDYR